MLTLRQNSPWKLACVVVLLVMVLAVPAYLLADKKRTTTEAPTKPGDQRSTVYFDVSKIVWPNPPAITRIKFLQLFTGEKIDQSLYQKKQKGKQKWMDRLAGTQNTDEIKIDTLPFQLIRTYGVAVDSKGKIYAGDQGVGAVFVFNSENKDQVELIANGKQAHFGMITGLAADDDDRLFVADAKLHRVLVFTPKREQEASVGAEVLVRPAGIAIDKENRLLYVADSGNDVVDVFDADSYKYLRQIGKPSKKHDQSEPGLFSLPEAVAVDSDGNVYVTDTFNNRLEIFDADGNFISMFGQNGDGPADFQRPKGIAVDGDGHIWVVDAAQNRVKVFDKEGRLLIYFGELGNYPGQFMSPWGIAIDKANRVVVSETFPGRVQVFRYVTDAEAATEKVQTSGGAKKAANSVTQQKAAASMQDVADKKSSAAH